MRNRELAATLYRAARTFPAIVVTGPRQSGKTTLLKEQFQSTHRYLNLEDPDIRRLALEDPRGFLRIHSPPVILDEIQYAPELLSYIKTRIDADRRPASWIMTGSQQFSLMAAVSESLAGRVAVLHLLPFSWRERRPAGSAEEIVLRGFYPELSENQAVDRQLWFSSYLQTYIDRDIRQLVQVGDLREFERFVRLCAARTGQILNLSELARDHRNLPYHSQALAVGA